MIKPMQDDQLIFMLSLPRSGSTMLQRILGSHSDIYTRSEPWLMLHPLSALKEGIIQARYNSRLAMEGVKDFLSGIRNNGEDHYFKQLGECHLPLYGAYLEESGKSRFLDKTPRYYEIFDELQRTFPRAKFIVLYRNPLAVLGSILETWIKSNFNKLKEYRCDLYEGIEFLQRDFSQHTNTICIRYEDLLLDPEQEVSNLFDFLELPYQPQCIDYGNQPVEQWKYGDPTTVHKKTRPDSEHITGWQQLLSHPDSRKLISDYLDILGKERLENMGYNFRENQEIILAAEAKHADTPKSTLSLSNLTLTDAETTRLTQHRNSKLRDELSLVKNQYREAEIRLDECRALVEDRRIHTEQLLTQLSKTEQVIISREHSIQHRDEHLLERERQITVRDELLSQRSLEISAQVEQIRDLEQRIKTCEELLSHRNLEIKERNQRLIDIEQQLTTRDELLSHRSLEIKERNERLIDLEQQLLARDKIISQQSLTISKLNQQLLGQNAEIHKMRNQSKSFELALSAISDATTKLKAHRAILNPKNKYSAYRNLLNTINSIRKTGLQNSESTYKTTKAAQIKNTD